MSDEHAYNGTLPCQRRNAVAVLHDHDANDIPLQLWHAIILQLEHDRAYADDGS